MEISLDSIKKVVTDNIFHFLWVGGSLLVSAGIWVGVNATKITDLEKRVGQLESIVQPEEKVIARHEWMTLNHEDRILYVEREKK